MRFGRARTVPQTEMDRRVNLLRKVEFFSAATDKELEGLAEALREREVAAGAEVVREGRLPTHVFVIVEGSFEVVSRGDRGGEARVVNVLREGDHFGEIGLIEGMPATATVRAEGPARIAEIPGRAFLSFVDQSASLTDVADRISTWLARTHPSYRPSAGGGAVAEGVRSNVAELLKGWEDAEVRELEAALLRLEALAQKERSERLRDLGV